MLQNIQSAVAGVIVLATFATSTINTSSLVEYVSEARDIAFKAPISSVEAEKQQDYTKPQLEAILRKYTDEYGISYLFAYKIISCESNWDYKVQSHYTYKKDFPEWGVKKGDRELSFGIAQIHLPSHKNITKEQALDPEFSIKFLVKEIDSGNESAWSCRGVI